MGAALTAWVLRLWSSATASRLGPRVRAR
jgi:hypothetical protein